MLKQDYGVCNKCGTPLHPVWFEEKERVIKDGIMYPTGRVRKACDHLICTLCGNKETVDDSFDGSWRG